MSSHSPTLTDGNVRPSYSRRLLCTRPHCLWGLSWPQPPDGIQRNHSSLYHVGLVTFTHLSTCVNSWNVYMNRYGKYSIITQYFSNAHIYDEYNLFGINL